MQIIWLGLLVEIFILALLQPLIDDFEGTAILAVLIHVVFTTIILLSNFKNKLFKSLFFLAFLLRVICLFWDSYVFYLPHSGADTEAFYRQALFFSQDILNLSDDGELYTKITGILFYVIGPQRLFGQYINTLLGLSVVLFIHKILVQLEVSPKITKLAISIAAFFPNSLFMSAIFLREMFPTFFVVASAFYFIRWFKSDRIINMILSFLAIGLASSFHAGVIGFIVGYALVFIFYQKNKDSYTFSPKSVVIFVLITMLFSAGFTLFADVLLVKFRNVDEMSDIYSIANARLGDSAYLENLTINNPIELIVYGPIKSFFFLTMPLPMYWRGFMDIFAFIFDSSIYLGAIIYLVRYRKKFGHRRTLVMGLVLALLGSVIIFGVGVTNAGTAVRHRQKLMPFVLVTLAVMMDGVSSTLPKRHAQDIRYSPSLNKR